MMFLKRIFNRRSQRSMFEIVFSLASSCVRHGTFVICVLSRNRTICDTTTKYIVYDTHPKIPLAIDDSTTCLRLLL